MCKDLVEETEPLQKTARETTEEPEALERKPSGQGAPDREAKAQAPSPLEARRMTWWAIRTSDVRDASRELRTSASGEAERVPDTGETEVGTQVRAERTAPRRRLCRSSSRV